MRFKSRAIISLVFTLMLLVPAISACQQSGSQPADGSLSMVIIPDAPEETPAGEPVKQICIACHTEMVNLVESSNHVVHDCAQCHIPGDHPTNPLAIKPVAITSADLCGGCHADQYRSFYTINLNSEAKLEKATPEGVAPLLDKLLAGHGFTKEHDEPRSHNFMLIDHLTVDRAYGGRFQLENWQDILKTGNVWDILNDLGAQYTMPESAKAANPVCLNCKTTDHILEWAYLGEPDPQADWDRTSDVVEFAKALDSPSMGCIMCHDPHTTGFRVTRDGLIQAIEEDGAFPYMEDNGDSLVQLEIKEFRNFRKIAWLDEPVANVLCAQCHVEYICNPGIDTASGQKTTMADQRSNYFPWVSVLDIYQHYQGIQFADFKHAITGATLVKLQHPDAETNWGSMHQLNGVECSDCHMPKLVNDKGDEYTSHWQTSPRNYIEQTCLQCHTEWTSQTAEYRIDAIQNYVKGKLSKAEYWLGRLIDTFEVAIRVGVSEDVLNEARECHSQAHILWEWWTAGNSGGFHNPDLARESLTKSVEYSRMGIQILEDALK